MPFPPPLMEIEGRNLNGVVDQRDRRRLHGGPRNDPTEQSQDNERPDTPRDRFGPGTSLRPVIKPVHGSRRALVIGTQRYVQHIGTPLN